MSKTNDTSNIATLEDHDTLADSELDAVSGGFYAVEHVAIGPRDDGKLPTLPCDSFDIICRILS